MFRLVKVRGDSMLPTLEDGDYVIIKRSSASRQGAVFVVDHPDLGLIVKRLVSLVEGRGKFAGDNAASTSPHEIGLVEMRHVRGRAIGAVTKKGLKRLPAKTD